VAAEAYQRHFHIVKQTGPGGVRGVLTRDEDVIRARNAQMGKKRAGGLAEAAAGAVADDGTADLLRRRKALAGLRAGRVPAAALDHHDLAAFGVTLSHEKEFTPFLEADNLQRRRVAVDITGDQALRRLRPLARREARIFWPFLVAMRERNPWRRLRFRLLGWNVLLVATGHCPLFLRGAGGTTWSSKASQARRVGGFARVFAPATGLQVSARATI
jgi:hypothetical protein